MKRVDFTLLLSDPVEDRSTLTFALQVPAADGIAPITEPLPRSCDLTRVTPAMAYPGPGRDVLLAAGLELGRALFPDLVAARLRRVFTAARERGGGVRIRILGGVALQRLPWEYTVLPPEQGEATAADFLALMPHASLVREQEGVARVCRADAATTIRILGCVAAPRSASAIDVERERQLLETALARPNVTVRWTDHGVRPSALLGAADLFHFAGHGVFETDRVDRAASAGVTRDVTELIEAQPGPDPRAGVLVFDDGTGGEDRMRAGDLAIVLRELGVRVAVINACNSATSDAQRWWSSVAAALLNGGIGSVIAMQHELLDASALAFANAFYGALADEHSLEDAMRRGRLAIFDRDSFGWGTPVLYLSAAETVTFSTSSPVVPAQVPAHPPIALPGWAGQPRHLAWSVDSAYLAASDGKGSCTIWARGEQWQPVRRLPVAAVDRCCGWIDARLVIARGERLYLVGEEVHELARVEHPVRCVLPLRSTVACIDAAGGAYLYEPDGCLRDRAPLGPSDWSEAAASPYDDTFAVATARGELAVWGMACKLVSTTVSEGIVALAFAAPNTLAAVLASGDLAAFASERRRISRLTDCRTIAGPVPVRPPLAIAACRATEPPAVNGIAIYTIAVPGPSPATALAATPTRDGVSCLAWSPDRAWLAVGTSAGITLHAAR